jgi:hypothetical protein
MSCLSFGCGSQGAAPNPLATDVQLPHTTFTARTPIPITVSIRNSSSRTITVNRRMAVNDINAPAAARDIAFDIRAASGKAVPFRWDVKIGPPESGDFGQLGPGRTEAATVDLADQFFLDQPGSYTVTAIYENLARGPIDPDKPDAGAKDVGAVRGRVASKPVKFTIVP